MLLLVTTLHLCDTTSGRSYVPRLGLSKETQVGWQDAKTSKSLISDKKGEGKYDILYSDETKQIASTVQEGRVVMLLNRGANDASFLVVQLGRMGEIYHFLVNKQGHAEYVHVANCVGSGSVSARSILMQGNCAF